MKHTIDSFLRYSAHLAALFSLALSPFMLQSCKRSSDDVWNDTKTAGRHVQRGIKSLGGKQSTSQQVKDRSEFLANRSNAYGYGSGNHDFVAFEDDPDQINLSMDSTQHIAPPQETPGEAGSSIPGIDSFKDPSQDPALATIFEHIYFDYNSSLIKSEENIRIVQNICEYLKKHPRTYIFIEGHCDKRGPSAYNFALGANRSNSVRNMLIAEGISPDRIFTISYGKERLIFEEDAEEFQSLNRRCQFKIYEQ